MVELREVHKLFGHLHVLRGIDLVVQRGEVCVLMGPSGSGKSTLIRCVNEMEQISAGRLFVNGELMGLREVTRADGSSVLHRLPDKEIARQRSKIGMVFQRFNLFPHMTALENVMEAPVQVKKLSKDQAKALALTQLERVGLADRVDHYPALALRRPAAAGGDSPRPGHGAGIDALRRADLGPGPGTGR